MKAAVLHEGGKLSIEDIPVPKITAGQVLIKVAACGVCHTDLHYVEHGLGRRHMRKFSKYKEKN